MAHKWVALAIGNQLGRGTMQLISSCNQGMSPCKLHIAVKAQHVFYPNVVNTLHMSIIKIYTNLPPIYIVVFIFLLFIVVAHILQQAPKQWKSIPYAQPKILIVQNKLTKTLDSRPLL